MAGIGFENAKNYKAYPGSFIGRQIGFFEVKHVDTNAGNSSNYQLDTNNFRLAIQTIQLQAEVLFVGTPVVSNGYGRFIVGLAVDTANPANPDDLAALEQSNQMAQDIQTALRAVPALNDHNDAVVNRIYLYGDYNADGGFKYTSDFISAIVSSTSTSYVGFAQGSVEQNELIKDVYINAGGGSAGAAAVAAFLGLTDL
jgi:hypothetical protein